MARKFEALRALQSIATEVWTWQASKHRAEEDHFPDFYLEQRIFGNAKLFIDSFAHKHLIFECGKEAVWFQPTLHIDPEAIRYFSPVRFPQSAITKSIARIAESRSSSTLCGESEFELLAGCGITFFGDVQHVEVFFNECGQKHLVIPSAPIGIEPRDIRRLANANDWLLFASGLYLFDGAAEQESRS